MPPYGSTLTNVRRLKADGMRLTRLLRHILRINRWLILAAFNFIEPYPIDF